MSATEIARAVNLSVKTVSTHRTRILAKTGLATRRDAFLAAGALKAGPA